VRQLKEQDELLKVEGLTKWFPVRTGFLSTLVGQQLYVKAVDDVSFTVRKGEILGLAGESGSGKTTTGRLILRLINVTKGTIEFRGRNIAKLSSRQLKRVRRQLQIIFQDPYESLNPRMLVKDIVAEPVQVQHDYKAGEEVEERVKQALREVELVPPEEFMYRYPHELSGGQRQRVAVARAFILNPELVVADEPVSMLDVSIRAEVLNNMVDLVAKRGASFVYITHDLALARHICDRIAVMYLGKIMEIGPADSVIASPLHPYTDALIRAVPSPDPDKKRGEAVISGEIPSPINPPNGCRFHTRCPYAFERCTQDEPPLIEAEPGHWAACHLIGEAKGY